MDMRRSPWPAIVALALAAVSASAPAQVRYYRGTTVPSSSGNSGGSSPPVYYGPTETPHYTPTPPGVGQAPEYITYMSARCASLHDAMRTANARGLDYRTQNEMRQNYTRECAEDEAEARNRWYRDRGEKKQMARSEEEAARRNQERTKQQQEQCGESKRILVTKRQRTDLTEGEKAELQRFEANYKARCT